MAATVASYYRVTLTAVATHDTRGTGGLGGLNGNATAHLINLATRAQIGGAAGTPSAGFMISGTGSKGVLPRAVGPGLTNFGVIGAPADPSLSLVAGATTIASNANWLAADARGSPPSGPSRSPAAGATPRSSRRSRPRATRRPSAPAWAAASRSSRFTPPPPPPRRLRAPSTPARAFVGPGKSVLIPGCVITGTGTVRLLFHPAGPVLAAFGVTGTLADPQRSLFSSASTLAPATNNNWSSATNSAAISAAAAFAVTAGSRDAALSSISPPAATPRL